jgi:proteasome lid subunit RPN8/RPN11|tara:strand:+ start:748 stop:1188 length:441 start_codon:yes stop_codon:yes gene_type:complete
VIRLPDPFFRTIADEAEDAYPMECCGLFVGRRKDAGDDVLITRVQPSPNVAGGDRRGSFLVDAKIQFDMMRELGDGPEQIVGHYHSHPDHPPRPSDRDKQSVYYPDHVWVIIGVEDGHAGEIAAYLFDHAADQFQQVDIVTGNPGN